MRKTKGTPLIGVNSDENIERYKNLKPDDTVGIRECFESVVERYNLKHRSVFAEGVSLGSEWGFLAG